MSAARIPVQPAGARVVISLAQTLAVGALAFLVLALAPGSARAQEPIDSTTELKRACEAGSHFIYVTTDVKITSGPQQSVASACQIALGPTASFEATGVSMSFAGPFRIDSSRERSVTFTNSTWKATSLGLYVDGAASFKSTASLLQATAGSVEIGAGSESLVQVRSHRAGSPSAVKATGSVLIYGGEKLFVDLADTGIEGRRGVRINLGGNDSVLKAESAQLRSPGGPLSVSAGSKALVELTHVALAAGRGNAAISLDGGQSVLKTAFTSISSQGGSVDLLAARHGAWTGAVELFESTVTATGGVRVQGSPEGQEGTVKVSASTLSGGSDVLFRTGARGTTDVKESRIGSATAIRIRTGLGGSCKAESNSYSAPVRQICP